MSNSLLNAIQDGVDSGKPLLWLEAEEFASRVLLKGNPLPWTRPIELVNTYRQLQDLLKPGVAPINVHNFLSAWLLENRGVLSEMAGKKRIRFAIKKLLSMEEPRQIIRDIIKALSDSVEQPIVLVLPPNGNLINWANKLANDAPAAEITDLDIDSVSVYLADFLRTFSGLRIAGIVIDLPDSTPVNSNLKELYSPIINVANYYHWFFGVKVNNPIEIGNNNQFIDLIISDHAQANSFMLTDEFWHGENVVDITDGFYFSELPRDIDSSSVLERISGLNRMENRV